MRTLLVAAALLAAFVVHGTAQQAPLPEASAFYEKVRQNAARSNREQHKYAYKERRTDLHTNPFGRIGTGGRRVFDVVPGPDGQSMMRRLIERDGVPVTDSRPERMNLPQRRTNTTGSRSVDDVVATLEFTITGREQIDGRPYIVVTFKPRPNARPSTRQGRLAKIFAGKMWVNEAAHEVERVEATAIDSLSYGLGLVARVGKGATVVAERKPVEGGVWMPTAVHFSGAGRALLFRKLNVDYVLEWFDYRLVESPTS